jgi:hypothetical protein
MDRGVKIETVKEFMYLGVIFSRPEITCLKSYAKYGFLTEDDYTICQFNVNLINLKKKCSSYSLMKV